MDCGSYLVQSPAQSRATYERSNEELTALSSGFLGNFKDVKFLKIFYRISQNT